MTNKITVTEGEFAGWQTYDHHDTFDTVVGPFYSRPDPDGQMRCAFRAEQKHMNAGDRMHGGCLMTFADIAMTPYVVRLDMMSMQPMWTNGRLPRVADWLDRIKGRPTFPPAFLDWMPDHLTDDLKTNGAQSWPEVAEILGIAA